MSDSDTEQQHGRGTDALGTSEAGHQVAALTGMSEEAAATFAAFHSGRFSRGPAFADET